MNLIVLGRKFSCTASRINSSDFSIPLIFLIFNGTDIASYADDNSLYNARDNIDAVAETLRMSAKKLF